LPFVILTGCLSWGTIPAVAQSVSARERETDLVVHAITLQYRRASDALETVHPLLSRRGTVELQPGGNTLVIRDVPQAIARILPLVREFDQPAGSVKVKVQIVSAGGDPVPGRRVPELPPEMMERLRELLRYKSYVLMGKTEVEVQEGLDAVYELDTEYRVDFRLGRLLEDRRIGLEGFKISRRLEDGAVKPLIHTNLNLDLNKPMILGLARTESSDRALMVVVECTRGEMQLSER
jgi:hypothetical protein